MEKDKDVKLHYFRGNVDSLGNCCETCGELAHVGNHYTNGGVVCDNPNGACCCGSWHGDFQKLENNKIFQWLKNFAETNPSALPLGIPCKHPGCLSHRTHPCENCGRQHGQFADVEDKVIGYIQDRYLRTVKSGEHVCHFGDCNFHNAHFPFCDCGLMRDLVPLEHSLALYLYPKFDEDYETQMETRSIVEEHLCRLKNKSTK